MPLVNSIELLQDAKKGNYAVGAFNIENMEMAQAVVEAAEQENAPVILQTTPSTVRYASLELYHAVVAAIAKHARVPVVLHLDHGSSFALAEKAVMTGYTSVMYDGSAQSFEENIRITKNVVEVASAAEIGVEAELGKVGGKEDDLVVEDVAYTDPQEAREFAQSTGIASLAVAIGTAHGIYASKPRLDIDRVKRIAAVVDVPLVLHGASGLPDEDVERCIRNGMCKVNFATELRIAYTDGIKELLRGKPDAFDPKALGEAGKEKVRELVKSKIRVCMCNGKATV